MSNHRRTARRSRRNTFDSKKWKVVETVDVTPTWTALLPIMRQVLISKKSRASAKRDIKAEIMRVARFLDKHGSGSDWVGGMTLYIPHLGKSTQADTMLATMFREADRVNARAKG